MTRRLTSFILLAAAALITLALIPGCWPDRAFLSLSALPLKDSRSFLAGDGSHNSPYRLQTFAIKIGEKLEKAPTIVSIDDDPGQVFQSSPPTPVDFAIILRNLKRLGMDRIAISFPLVWRETDVISLTALDRELNTIPSLATAAPLTRGAVPSPIPPAFRRASIPLAKVRGNPNLLPPVNRIALPDVILGDKTALAGFTRIESEPDTTSPFMIAKWGEDHAVLSFLLITVLNHYDVPPSEIEVRLGEYISLGANAPYIPIDDYGRLDLSLLGDFDEEILPMESLLKMEPASQSKKTFQPTILRSDLSATEEASAAFAGTITPTIATLCNPTNTRTFSRLPISTEVILLLSLAGLASCLLHFKKSPWKIVAFSAIGGLVVIHFITIAAASVWLPTLPALLIFIIYAVLSSLKNRNPKPTPALQPAAEDPPTTSLSEEPHKPTSGQPAKKAPQRANQNPPTKTSKSRRRKRRKPKNKPRRKN